MATSMTKEELLAQIEMLKEQLLDAKNEATKTVKHVDAKTANPENFRLVNVRLPRDNNRYRDDLYVNLNDKNYLIKRGVTVQVPWCVAEIIRQSADADEKTAMMITELTDSYVEL